MEEERSHGACSRSSYVACGSEVTVDESGRRAVRIGHCNSVTIRTVRRLRHACWNRNDVIAVEAASYAIIHCTLRNRRGLACAWTRSVWRLSGIASGRRCYKTSVLELFDDQ